MHFVIVNASPHRVQESNTALIASAFRKGIEKAGGTSEIYNLSQKSQWDDAERAFCKNVNIIFALPVFAATIPGIMKQFLEQINVNRKVLAGKKISFIVQCGFPEAHKRRFCENYLKSLPAFFEADFSGILSYGINSRFIDNKELDEMLFSFEAMGTCFAENSGSFFFEAAEKFTGKEYITEKEAKKFNRIFNFFCKHIAESKGCTDTDYQPLSKR